MPLDATNTSLADIAPTTGLANAALQTLPALYEAINHHPSAEQWAAIADLLQHMELAANDALDSNTVYLSAIPAGTGESTSLQAFAAVLVSDPAHSDTGMLIAVNRKQEAADMAKALAAHRDRLCVICSEPEVRALGDHAEANSAQIVVTTQAALKETLKDNRDFAAAARYHYRDKKRAVVAWDESIAFNRPVVLDNNAVLGLAGALEQQSLNARTALLEWSVAVSRHSGGICGVPDFEALGVDLLRLEQDAATDELVAHAKALAVISGGKAWIVKDNRLAGASLITHYPELPPSLLPLIVTDASGARGVHHASYDQMASQRNIVRLKEASKTYRNLTIRVVPIAASRSVYRDRNSTRGKELIDVTVAAIRSVAPEKVLVGSYRNSWTIRGVAERTIKAAITARLNKTERERVSHLHWGSHTATDDFRDHRYVILPGLNFVPIAAAHASSGAAMNKPMRTEAPSDHPTQEDIADMRRGMLRDSTLQAILRGNARLSVYGDCGTMEAVIFQSRQMGLSREDLLGMFPGATIMEDRSLLPTKPLRGNLKKLAAIVQGRLEGGETEMSDQSLIAAMDIKASNFGKLKGKSEWRAWLVTMGLHSARLSGGLIGLQRAG